LLLLVYCYFIYSFNSSHSCLVYSLALNKSQLRSLRSSIDLFDSLSNYMKWVFSTDTESMLFNRISFLFWAYWENSKYYLFHFKYYHFLHLILEFIQLICYFPSLFMRFFHSNNHLRVSNPKSFNSIHQSPFSRSHSPLLVSHVPSQTPRPPFRNAQFLRLTFCFLK